MTIPTAVLSHIRANWPELQWPYAEHVAALAVRETARECAELCLHAVDSSQAMHEIRARYGVTP